ncbi:hypothetical protein [Nocardia sp. NPDC059239]
MTTPPPLSARSAPADTTMVVLRAASCHAEHHLFVPLDSLPVNSTGCCG